MKKQSPIIKILLFPINLLKYEVLGIYYTLYALLYPFIFIFNKIGDKAYSKYEENARKNSGVKEMVEEEVNLDSGTSAFKGEEKKEIWIGTESELSVLTTEEKNKYSLFITTDEHE